MDVGRGACRQRRVVIGVQRRRRAADKNAISSKHTKVMYEGMHGSTYRHGLGTQQPAASVQLKPAKHVIVGLGWYPVEHCRLAAANCASQLPLGLS
jgi:hypothetical protein